MKRSYEIETAGILGETYKTEQNNMMTMRLKNTKSMVNTSCPKSFISSRKQQNHFNTTNSSKIIFF